MNEYRKVLYLVAGFLTCFYLPIENLRFQNALFEALALVKWYAREHVILCLIPAFFIAGAISAFISQAAVLKYFGAKANKILAYSVASVSGTILAVCSCTVLPLFSGIYKRGAGLGPAVAFLYSGPAINVLAMILTARILGWQLGLARAIGAIIFSVVIGLLMHVIFLKEERIHHVNDDLILGEVKESRPLWRDAVYFFSMVAVLVFLNWSKPEEQGRGLWSLLYTYKWILSTLFLSVVGFAVIQWFKKEELQTWIFATRDFALQMMPLLFIGIFMSGFFLGRPGSEGLIPSGFVEALVGGNSFRANFFSALVSALMYFCTLAEVPILQGLISSGMGQGPALTLLLAGPALSLPNILVIRGVIGTKKTLVYVFLVVIMATISGMIFGNFLI